MLSFQGGIKADLFSWSMVNRKERAVKYEDDPLAGQFTASGFTHSTDSNITDYYFTYPKLSFALGFTFNFRQMASLDFVFINVTNPTAAGSIYKAVGDGLGSDATSVVLTLKF
jgi:hypothetical protein